MIGTLESLADERKTTRTSSLDARIRAVFVARPDRRTVVDPWSFEGRTFRYVFARTEYPLHLRIPFRESFVGFDLRKATAAEAITTANDLGVPLVVFGRNAKCRFHWWVKDRSRRRPRPYHVYAVTPGFRRVPVGRAILVPLFLTRKKATIADIWLYRLFFDLYRSDDFPGVAL